MNPTLRITILIAVLLYFICIFYLLKRGKLDLKYTLLWIFSGLLMILFVAFPVILESIIHLFGVVEMTNGLFAVIIFAILIILVSVTSIVSTMNEKLRKLIQQCAMYEKRIRELEQKIESIENR